MSSKKRSHSPPRREAKSVCVGTVQPEENPTQFATIPPAAETFVKVHLQHKKEKEQAISALKKELVERATEDARLGHTMMTDDNKFVDVAKNMDGFHTHKTELRSDRFYGYRTFVGVSWEDHPKLKELAERAQHRMVDEKITEAVEAKEICQFLGTKLFPSVIEALERGGYKIRVTKDPPYSSRSESVFEIKRLCYEITLHITAHMPKYDKK